MRDNTNLGRQVIIIDEHPLRGAGLESVFSQWAESEGLKIRGVCSIEEVVSGEGVNFEMCLLSLGGLSLNEARAWQTFSALKNKFSDKPVVVFSDVGTDVEVRLAYLGGARGLLHTRMRTNVVVAALSFILSGGEYFPPCGWREHFEEHLEERVPETVQVGLHEPAEVPRIVSPEAADHSLALSIGSSGPRDCEDTRRSSSDTLPLERLSLEPVMNEQGLTKRQDDVLELVKVGRSNKEIARALDLSESTVKIHVRQIMKKMGVANRTQVALRATQRPHS